MGDFDSSDEDLENLEPSDEFRIDFVNVPRLGLCDSLALSALPGCRFRENRRNLERDVATVVSRGITDVFVLLTLPEMRKYRTPTLVQEYYKNGLTVHHYPMEDGGVPGLDLLLTVVSVLRDLVVIGRSALVHCYGGLGRTCLVAAALLLQMDPLMSPDAAILFLRNLRGPRAVQTVRQYNMIQEFRHLVEQKEVSSRVREDRSRSASR